MSTWRKLVPHQPEATPSPPRLLNRPSDAPRSSAAAWPSPPTSKAPRASAAPPISGSASKLRGCSVVPDTPESQQGMPTPPPRSFVEVVKGEAQPVFNSTPSKAPATKPKSAITIPTRSNYYSGSNTPPRQDTAQRVRVSAAPAGTAARRHHVPPAATARGAFNSPAPTAEEGWVKVKEPYWWRKCRDSLHNGAPCLR
ncbi:hypothetical protein PVAP13_4NG298598 [Panicum virgatum]|uniref:Uncharacterized protein n=1 Tax=Panicum virgatum TaxID=38727 RepID=A0A8T0TCA9_PANVG|nr:hypothetical protein PVAP13_4NG298598 [Panicum virgatum]